MHRHRYDGTHTTSSLFCLNTIARTILLDLSLFLLLILQPVAKLTVSLTTTYKRCNPAFTYAGQKPARRVLTKPSEPAEGQLYDNINSDLIVAVDDVLTSTLGSRYIVTDTLGQGTFGQVFKCRHEETGDTVAIKVIKNQPAYFHQARVEIGVLQFLNTRADADDKHHIVRLQVGIFSLGNHSRCLLYILRIQTCIALS